jgi:hypothetical protein
VTSRADEIQKLIADIDNLLNSSGKRLTRLLSSQAPEAREVLERIRQYLVQQGETEVFQSPEQNQVSGQGQKSPLLEKFVEQAHNQSAAQQNQVVQDHRDLISQQLKTELTALMQPLQAELATMLQERATLVQEIRQLEQRRLHNYSLSQQWANQEQMISEFLQVLMSRLPALMSQNRENIASSNSQQPRQLASAATQPFLESTPQTERLTHLSQDLDQSLLSLDGTVNVVFEALQRNINTYHESLSQSLARMHNTGVQGEQLMVNFLNSLTQHLPQTLSSNQSSNEGGENQSSFTAPEATQPAQQGDLANQMWQLLETETATSLTFNGEEEDIDVTDNLDAMLLELGVDDSLASEPASIEFKQDNLELISDEIDQLYVSLLGTEKFTSLNLDVSPAVVTAELSFPTEPAATEVIAPELSAPQITKTIATSPIEPVAAVPDPWSEVLSPRNTHLQATQDASIQPQDSSSDSWQGLFFAEDSDPGKSIGSSEFSQTQVAVTDDCPIQPSSADTITALSDLFVDMGSEQEWLGIASPLETAVVTPPEIAVVDQSEVVVKDEEQEQLLDNYIAASPQENLLLPEDSHAATVSDIFLDEGQWQQLHQDLANFDELLDSNFDLDVFAESIDQHKLANPSTPDIAGSSADVSQITPISWPQTEADLDFSPTESIEQAVNLQPESSSISISSSKNHPEVAPDILDSVWYLGIDVGTTGISAALLNHDNSVVYPIYWSADNQQEVTSFQQSFRLPAEVYLPSTSRPQEETASQTDADHLHKSAKNPQNNFYSAQLKPYLQVAVPYKSEQQKWEPVLQFNEFAAGPLIWVVRSLSKLLLTLKADRHSTTQGLIATAVGLNEKTFHHIINQIAGVICTCPSNWSEQYRFNVREALLTSKLVQHPQQVFFVEEAIASLLSTLDGANGEIVQLSDRQGLRSVKNSDHPVVGQTLVINIGATATEMALVDLPENLQQLKHNDFLLHSFAYASKGIEQDIICQLLLPSKYRQTRFDNQGDSKTITSNPWQWQPAFPGLDQMRWQSLGLEKLELPKVGEPDIPTRIRLQQHLESSLLGQAVLDAALALKLILQHQDTFTLDLADQRWTLQRRDLETQVFIPFVRRLNRELNKLLVAKGIPTEAINQALLTGGVASLGVVNNWLKQKLPNAKIIQDLYLGENGAPNCSRVAYGLAMLPLHPQVLEEPRQQYTDYFLFRELLGLLPDRTLSFGEVLQLFEGRGINTSICQQRLLAFLEGELPPGLIPANPDAIWLTPSSQNNSHYQAIAATPLFEKQGNLTYQTNSQQLLVLRRYLDAIKASTQQPMEEPYTVNFALAATGDNSQET